MFLSLCRYLLTERRGLRHRVVELAAKLEAEASRNRQREDELVSRLLTNAGTYGLQARKPSQSEPKPVDKTLAPLTSIEEARLEAWLTSGRAMGKTDLEIEQDFYNARRNGFQEVYAVPVGME